MNNQTIIALIRMAVPVILSVGTYFGYAWDADLVFLILMTVASIAAMIWAAWKNNNVTNKAQVVEQAGLEYWNELQVGLNQAAEEYTAEAAESASEAQED